MTDVLVFFAMLAILAFIFLVTTTLWLVVQLYETRAIARQLARAHILANRYDKWGADFGFQHDHDDDEKIGTDPLGDIFGTYTHGGGGKPVPKQGKHWKYQP